MSKKSFDEQLAAVEALRNGPAGPAAAEALGKALANRNNYVVAKAAAAARELGLKSLLPELLAALERFFSNPVKSDPQCWAKNAIVAALVTFGCRDSAVFLRGLRHFQMEPVWGGVADTAGALRGKCAAALVECSDLSDLVLLSHLIERLVDPDKTVRVEAALAIGRISRPEAALLLRLRALSGDPDPEAAGACFTSLLAIEGCAGIDFVARFLDFGGDAAGEAALALGSTHEPRALALLTARWRQERDRSLAGVLLTAMALTRLPEALDFLLDLVENDASNGAAAIEALACFRTSEEVRLRVESAVTRNGAQALRVAFEKNFGSR